MTPGDAARDPALGDSGRGAGPAPDRLDRPFSDPLVQRLFPPLATGVHWDLERTVRALDELGNPHRAFPTVHVGGTNGKGSVAATVHAVLQSSGVRTGLYTSPHLCSFRERYRVGDALVEARVLEAAAREIREVVTARGLTFFEAITVLAFHLFAREGVEAGVVEVGLGGRLDATNVLRPEICGITNVALDHAEYLGDTLPAIAREKAGIIKPGIPVVVAERDPELLAIFREVARERGAPLARAPLPRDVRVARDGTVFTVDTATWGTRRLETPLAGAHQAVNAALAVGLLERLPPALRPSADEVQRGVAGVRWPGRDQVEVVDGRTWLLDVAHNIAGIASLVDTLDRLELPRPWVGLVGILGDKDWRAMLPPLLTRLDGAWLTRPVLGPPERRWDPAEAARILTSAGHGSGLRVVPEFGLALGAAREAAGEGTVVVTGSVYTVGSALQALGCAPWSVEPGPPGGSGSGEGAGGPAAVRRG